MNSIKYKHKRIAIIPFSIEFGAKVAPKKTSPAEIKSLQEKTGRELQKSLFDLLAKDQRKGKLSVNLQDIDTTGQLLNRASINYDDIGLIKSDSLAKLLNVDAIFRGEIYMDRAMSEGATIVAKAILPLLYVSNDNFNYNLHLDNGIDGEVLWRLKKDTHPSPSIEADGSDDPIVKLLRLTERKFPYKLEKN